MQPRKHALSRLAKGDGGIEHLPFGEKGLHGYYEDLGVRQDFGVSGKKGVLQGNRIWVMGILLLLTTFINKKKNKKTNKEKYGNNSNNKSKKKNDNTDNNNNVNDDKWTILKK